MKRGIAAGLAIGAVLLLPALLSPDQSVSYSVAAPVLVPTVMAAEKPHSAAIGSRAVESITLSTETAQRPATYFSYHQLMVILAETSWRPYITSMRYYDPESDEWIWDKSMQIKLYKLVMCESAGRPDAVGDLALGPSIGLFQINTRYWSDLAEGYDLTDPEDNAQVAYLIWKISGESFRLWSCDPTEG